MLTLFPHLLISNTVTRDILVAVLVVFALLVGTKHVIEEVELGRGDGR